MAVLKSMVTHAKMGHVSETMPPFRDVLVVPRLGLATINVYTKFEVPVFTHYETLA